MRLHRTGIALVTVVTLATTVGLTRSDRSPGVTVHEWGTFTSVAGADGRAIDWFPLSGPSDLPCFVKHVNANVMAKLLPNSVIGAQIPFEAASSRLLGKVRMETPVIYFYSPTDVDANVSVRFTRGIITEFYPSPVEPTLAMYTNMLGDPTFSHSLEWNVHVSPNIAPLYPNGGGESHYYAARNTDATPLKAGVETEKFIFYRGVASFDVPIRTKVLANGDVEISNLLPEDRMPAAILFESRGGRMGFRVAENIWQSATLARPALTTDAASIRKALRERLERAGLYPKEAQAMVDTWRDSWFEEGSRVFYILPQRESDVILPLRITPAPTAISRVFVGRMELVDRATMSAVQTALDVNDGAMLDRYGRFLGPIGDRLIAGGADARTRDRLAAASKAAYAKYMTQLRACE
jgi:hypothetical protein